MAFGLFPFPNYALCDLVDTNKFQPKQYKEVGNVANRELLVPKAYPMIINVMKLYASIAVLMPLNARNAIQLKSKSERT